MGVHVTRSAAAPYHREKAVAKSLRPSTTTRPHKNMEEHIMKSLKLIGLSLLALFALGALAVTASAEEGFLVGGNERPTIATVLGGESLLEEEKGIAPIKCKSLDDSTITFEKENDKHAKGTLHWLGCTILGADAHSLSLGKEEILIPVLFLVCLDAKNAAGTLIDNFGIEGAVEGTAHVEAPAIGALILIKGAALGAVLTAGKVTLFNVEFTGKGGKQTITECLEGANKKVHNLLASMNEGKTFVNASENVTGGLVSFAKVTELMDS